MKVISINEESVELILEGWEVDLIRGCLREAPLVLNREFSTRTGFSIEQADDLSRKFHAIVHEHNRIYPEDNDSPEQYFARVSPEGKTGRLRLRR
jgi:hypothetical protein